MEIQKTQDYHQLVNHISSKYEANRNSAAKYINTMLIDTYWHIGQYIVAYEQGGNAKAIYGKRLLSQLSKDLSLAYGKGFSVSNLTRMRQFFIAFPICAELPHKLSWTHFVELIKIDDPLERSFYTQQTMIENWSTTELKRQKSSSLYHRLALSKNKDEILKLASQGQIIEKPADIIRDPYVLEFLNIPENYALSESELEKNLIDQLQYFLLELGKGFAFIGRQYRITLGNIHHYVDLVFYHRILKCFVLIDLKKEKVGYEDVGQMNMYLGYFENEENTQGDNPPIGIVLAKEKDDILVQYAMHNISSQLFVSKYQLYLPNKEELQAIIAREFNKKNR